MEAPGGQGAFSAPFTAIFSKLRRQPVANNCSEDSYRVTKKKKYCQQIVIKYSNSKGKKGMN